MDRPRDPLLVKWGENIERTRRLRTPDGQVRRNKLQACMSQEALGQFLVPNVTQATVSRWEKGLMEPRRQYKTQIAAALGVDAESLFPMPLEVVA